MYSNEELNISPDYQRVFQWSEGTQSRFIESLILEMPVPPVYMVEEEDNHYLLIDGLQRISSYLHLRGELVADHLEPPIKQGDKLTLVDCDIVSELNGKTFDSLPMALQIRLKRAFVRVEVVKKSSNPQFKYHMFKRLNTGGEKLSPQQVRNCTIRLLSPGFNDFIIRLSQTEAFVQCTESLTQEKKNEALDQELVLRFFAFKNDRQHFRHDVADFLTEFMEKVSDPARNYPFDYQDEERVFLKTFAVFGSTLGERAFCYANKSLTSITGGFSVYHFEAFTIGIQSRLTDIDLKGSDLTEKLKNLFAQIKFDPEFYKITTGGGKNSPGPLRDRINFVQAKIEQLL